MSKRKQLRVLRQGNPQIFETVELLKRFPNGDVLVRNDVFSYRARLMEPRYEQLTFEQYNALDKDKR